MGAAVAKTSIPASWPPGLHEISASVNIGSGFRVSDLGFRD